MALVRIPDGRIGYDSAGIGQVVVLAHADLMDRRMWQAQIDALSDRNWSRPLSVVRQR